MGLAGGKKPRVLQNRMLADGGYHTILASTEPSKASLTMEIFCARATRKPGRRRLFAERREEKEWEWGERDINAYVHGRTHG